MKRDDESERLKRQFLVAVIAFLAFVVAVQLLAWAAGDWS